MVRIGSLLIMFKFKTFSFSANLVSFPVCKPFSSSIPEIGDEPLYTWWALLPPPLDVVVGLRQVHFLSEFWRITRNEEPQKDIVAQELFPFISSPRFTLKEFFRTPSMWFWFTNEMEDFDIELLKEKEEAQA
jgi:hypothetical protein